MEKQSTALLKKHGLQITSVRKNILQLFLEAKSSALSSANIEDKIGQLNRITLYRTLRTFEKAGIIHQVLDNSGTTKYAYFSEPNPAGKHQNHAHFHCVKCKKTVCLANTPLPNLKMPSGYQVEEQHLALSGTCNLCQ